MSDKISKNKLLQLVTKLQKKIFKNKKFEVVVKSKKYLRVDVVRGARAGGGPITVETPKWRRRPASARGGHTMAEETVIGQRLSEEGNRERHCPKKMAIVAKPDNQEKSRV